MFASCTKTCHILHEIYSLTSPSVDFLWSRVKPDSQFLSSWGNCQGSWMAGQRSHLNDWNFGGPRVSGLARFLLTRFCSQRAALLSGDYQYCSIGNYQSCWNWLLRFKAVSVPYCPMVYWFSAFWCTCDHAIHHQLTDHLNQWLFVVSVCFSWNLLLLPTHGSFHH